MKQLLKKKSILIVVSLCSVLIAAGALFLVFFELRITQKPQPLLTQGMDQISYISTKVTEKNGSITTGTISKEQAKESAEWIYKNIKSTSTKTYKITNEEKAKVGYPVFVLAITYANGNKDIICSDKTGHFIYRVLNINTKDLMQATDFSMLDGIAASHDCVGGTDKDLVAVISNGAIR